MATEPCLWIDADKDVEKGPTSSLRQIVWRDERGRRVIERVPARCAAPDGDAGTPMRFKRWLPLLRIDGNMVRVPLTNAAAHVDTNTTYAQNQIEKAKRNGGFRFDTCILSQVYGRTAWKQAIMDPGVLADVNSHVAPCPEVDPDEAEFRLCRHVIAEAAARKAARKAEDEARKAAAMSEAQKQEHELQARTADAMAAIAEAGKDANEQTRALLQQMMTLIQSIAPAKPDKGNGGR